MAVLTNVFPIRRVVELRYFVVVIDFTTPHVGTRDVVSFANGRAVLRPNHIEVALTIQLQVKRGPLQTCLVTKQNLDPQPLVNVLVLVGSIQAVAVNHVSNSLDNGVVHTAAQHQTLQVEKPHVVLARVNPLVAIVFFKCWGRCARVGHHTHLYFIHRTLRLRKARLYRCHRGVV